METNLQGSIRGTILRGGTSNGMFVDEADFDVPKEARNEFLLGIFGSPDSLQVDGIGGGKSHNSKFVSVRRSMHDEYDIEYTYAQVGVRESIVDWQKISGNLTSAVGMFALLKGLVTGNGDEVTISIYNTNTGMAIDQTVPLKDGEPDVYGDYSISGVPNPGARVTTTFYDPIGRITGSLLPTGNEVDEIDLGDSSIEVSVVDATNLVAYLRASDLNLVGTELPSELETRPDLLLAVDRIREKISRLLEHDGDEPVISIGIVSEPNSYTGINGTEVRASEMDILTRFISLQPHHAIGTSSAMCTGAAVRIPGTIPYEYAGSDGSGDITIGHPKGTITVDVDTSTSGGDVTVESITNYRTARPIMDGCIFYRHPERFVR